MEFTQTNLFLQDPLQDAVDELHAATAIYTAEPVVDQLLDKLSWPASGKTLVDPSSGNGMFLVRALERLLEASGKLDESDFQVLEGWEIHPGACDEARQRIATRLLLAGYQADVSRRVSERMVVCADFLTDGPTAPRWDIIAGNPPYLRWLKVPALLRQLYEPIVPGYAAADLLHSFLDRCVTCLKAGGRIGFVTSDRWLINKQAGTLRARIGHTLAITLLERLDCQSAFFRPKNRTAGTPPRVHPVAVILADCNDPAAVHQLTDQPIYPGVESNAYADMLKLGEVAEIKLAPWLGTDGVFLVDATVASNLPAGSVVPVLAPGDWSKDGLAEPSRFAICTAPGTVPHETVQRHLLDSQARQSSRAKQGSPWMPPEGFHSWDLEKPMLVLPRILSSINPIELAPGRLPISHQLAIQCDSQAQLAEISEALRHPVAMQWVRDHAPRLENGYFQLSATLLRKMPLANCTTHGNTPESNV